MDLCQRLVICDCLIFKNEAKLISWKVLSISFKRLFWKVGLRVKKQKTRTGDSGEKREKQRTNPILIYHMGTGAQGLGPSSSASPRSWTGSEVVETQTAFIHRDVCVTGSGINHWATTLSSWVFYNLRCSLLWKPPDCLSHRCLVPPIPEPGHKFASWINLHCDLHQTSMLLAFLLLSLPQEGFCCCCCLSSLWTAIHVWDISSALASSVFLRPCRVGSF